MSVPELVCAPPAALLPVASVIDELVLTVAFCRCSRYVLFVVVSMYISAIWILLHWPMGSS